MGGSGQWKLSNNIGLLLLAGTQRGIQQLGLKEAHFREGDGRLLDGQHSAMKVQVGRRGRTHRCAHYAPGWDRCGKKSRS